MDRQDTPGPPAVHLARLEQSKSCIPGLDLLAGAAMGVNAAGVGELGGQALTFSDNSKPTNGDNSMPVNYDNRMPDGFTSQIPATSTFGTVTSASSSFAVSYPSFGNPAPKLPVFSAVDIHVNQSLSIATPSSTKRRLFGQTLPPYNPTTPNMSAKTGGSGAPATSASTPRKSMDSPFADTIAKGSLATPPRIARSLNVTPSNSSKTSRGFSKNSSKNVSKNSSRNASKESSRTASKDSSKIVFSKDDSKNASNGSSKTKTRVVKYNFVPKHPRANMAPIDFKGALGVAFNPWGLPQPNPEKYKTGFCSLGHGTKRSTVGVLEQAFGRPKDPGSPLFVSPKSDKGAKSGDGGEDSEVVAPQKTSKDATAGEGAKVTKDSRAPPSKKAMMDGSMARYKTSALVTPRNFKSTKYRHAALVTPRSAPVAKGFSSSAPPAKTQGAPTRRGNAPALFPPGPRTAHAKTGEKKQKTQDATLDDNKQKARNFMLEGNKRKAQEEPQLPKKKLKMTMDTRTWMAKRRAGDI